MLWIYILILKLQVMLDIFAAEIQPVEQTVTRGKYYKFLYIETILNKNHNKRIIN